MRKDVLFGYGPFPRFTPEPPVSGLLAAMTFGEVIALSNYVSAEATTILSGSCEEVASAFIQTGHDMPHLASVLACGFVIESEIRDMEDREADPKTSKEGMPDTEEGGHSTNQDAIEMIAWTLRDEIESGTGGQVVIENAIRRCSNLKEMTSTVDPIRDYASLRSIGHVEYAFNGWKRMAGRYGPDMTVGDFIAANLPPQFPPHLDDHSA